MKNFISLSLILFFLFLPLNFAFGEEIEDDFVLEYYLGKNLKTEIEQVYFEDDLANGLKFKGTIKVNSGKYEDKFPGEHFRGRKFKKRVVKAYDYSFPNKNKVKIHSTKLISTKQKLKEGGYVSFSALHPFNIRGKHYPKGTIIKAKIETISKRGLRGVPSDLILGNFQIDGTKEIIDFELSKRGANRTIWLYPVALVAGVVVPGSGFALNFIQGGHAKIKPDEVFEIELE